jgi:predicted ATPase
MALAALGQFEEGRSCNDEAMILAERTGERWFDAEISRVAGEMELLSPGRDAAKAQACFERALEIARAQQARSWELRAATSLARLWHEQGRRAEALHLLAPIYGWFTEGFDTGDLKEAKTMLDALAS